MKIKRFFFNIRPAALTPSSNSGEMETFIFDFSPKFCNFRINSRYVMDIKPNNRPKKGKVRSPVYVTYTMDPGISGKRLRYLVGLGRV